MPENETQSNKEIKVRVGKALNKDANHGIACLDPFIQEQMGLNNGDVISIASLEGKRTAAKIWPGLQEDKSKGIIRMYNTIRSNVGNYNSEKPPLNSDSSFRFAIVSCRNC
jgi:hypothetical protein